MSNSQNEGPVRTIKDWLSSCFSKPISRKRRETLKDSFEGEILIRIHRSNLEVTDGSGPSPGGHLYLVRGPLNDIRTYAGENSAWIIKIATLICDPLNRYGGHVITHPDNDINWHITERDNSWRRVTENTRLRAGIYEYVPSVPVSLSEISRRRHHSRRSSVSEPVGGGSTSTFRTRLVDRDGGCVVTRSVISTNQASHLIPKHMEIDGVLKAIERFCGEEEAKSYTNVFDERIGILLSCALGVLVDTYKVGFYHTKKNKYILHNFMSDVPNLSYFGIPLPLEDGEFQGLHGFPVTLSEPDPKRHSLPPPGVFNWHYLQCVIEKFGTEDYKQIHTIFY